MSEIEVDSRIERIIWRSAGIKSARQVAEETGISPEQVLRIRNELLNSVDELTIQQMRAKLLVDLQEIADIARDDYDSEPDRDKGSKLLTAAIGAQKAVLQELARMEKADNGRIEALNDLRVKELLRLIDLTVARTLAEIASTYDLDESTLHGIFQSHLKPAAEEIDA